MSRAEPASWLEDALCAQTDPEAFFPEKDLAGDQGWNAVRQAKATCRACPVLTDCLTFAISQRDPMPGIWGGTTAKERVPLRRARRREHGLGAA